MHAPHILRPWDSKASNSIELTAEARLVSGVMHFTFELSGETGEIQLPSLKSSRERKDELWRATCLEIFFGSRGISKYMELNVSPNGDWNLYAFDSYRSGMHPVSDAVLEIKESALVSGRYVLKGHLQSRGDGELKTLLSGRSLEASMTAVIAFKNQETQYWAVKHAGEKPDFHLRPSFSIEIKDTHLGET